MVADLPCHRMRLEDAVSVWNVACLTVVESILAGTDRYYNGHSGQSRMGRLALERVRPVPKAMYVASMKGQPASRARIPEHPRASPSIPEHPRASPSIPEHKIIIQRWDIRLSPIRWGAS